MATTVEEGTENDLLDYEEEENEAPNEVCVLSSDEQISVRVDLKLLQYTQLVFDNKYNLKTYSVNSLCPFPSLEINNIPL